MKSFSMLALVVIMMVACAQSQSQTVMDKKERKAIEQTITAFVKAGDQRSVDKLSPVLNEHFRTVVNRLFGSEEISLMDKETYLKLIKAEKIGGDKRDIDIVSIDIENNIASAKVILTGKELRFTSYYTLLKGVDNSWTIVNDTPSIESLKKG